MIDPSGDIYQMMDEVSLTGGTMLQGKKPMTTIVNEIRQKLNEKLVAYIELRDDQVAAEAYNRGRAYEQARKNN